MEVREVEYEEWGFMVCGGMKKWNERKLGTENENEKGDREVKMESWENQTKY